MHSSSLPAIPDTGDETGSEWLGAYLLTPHYKTLTVAIRPPERTMRSALDLLQNKAPDIPGVIFDTVLPLQPQRFEGVGSFIRFSSSMRNVGAGGHAAIVLDLTRVGGHYFAAILACELSYGELLEYIVPLTHDDDAPLDVYIGCRTKPWPSCALVTLRDGEVVTVIRRPHLVSQPVRAEHLFRPETRWEPPQQIPRLGYVKSLCVLYRDRRYALPQHHHTDQTVVEYVTEKLRLDPHATAMCTFPIGDLDVQGEHSEAVVAVAEAPSPRVTGMTRDLAQDIFVLLDARPFGIKPQFLFVHYPVLHLPTIITALGLHTSPAVRVGVIGGDRGDHIHIVGNPSLLLYPEIKPQGEGSTSSSSSSPLRLLPPWEDEDMPQQPPQEDSDEEWGQQSSFTFAGVPLVDPTLPAGHGWNVDEPPEHPDSSALRDASIPMELQDTAAAPVHPAPEDTSASLPPEGQGPLCLRLGRQGKGQACKL